MLISELARQAGTTPDTIRFYEKKGLLDMRHATRRDNNYKDYDMAALKRLHLIAQAKCAGFTLRETLQMLDEWEALGPAPRREMFTGKIKQIERRIAELEKVKAYLSAIAPICLSERTP